MYLRESPYDRWKTTLPEDAYSCDHCGQEMGEEILDKNYERLRAWVCDFCAEDFVKCPGCRIWYHKTSLEKGSGVCADCTYDPNWNIHE